MIEFLIECAWLTVQVILGGVVWMGALMVCVGVVALIGSLWGRR